MQGHKSNPPTSQSTRPKNVANSLAPYDQLPVKLRFHHMRPFSQLLNNSQYCLQRREKVRDITHKTLERDFRQTHELNQNKETEMLRTFKIRCKRKDQNNKTISKQEFFMGQLEKRQHQLRKLNEEYLSVLRQQLGKVVKSQDRQQQKLINQYNIIYEYRADKVPNPLKLKDK